METKPRILYLKKILEERTDEEHPLSTTQLINILNDEYGISAHRTTVTKDIAALQEFGIRRIIRDCNDEQFLHSDEPDVLLPHFSCHSLRHTFTTRMCEAGVNIKVIQDALGHSDISTTLNIYADVTKEMKAEEFKGLDSYFKV